MDEQRELQSAIEVIPGQLYFVCLRTHPRPHPSRFFFTVDEEPDMQYEPFFADFGPLHLGKVVKFCKRLEALRADPDVANRKIYFYTSHDGHRRANAACLAACYGVIVLKKTAEDAFRPFLNAYPPFIPFRDASYGMSTFNLTILDVVRGLHKAIECGFFKYDSFDLESYLFYERVENGDMNWVLPGKFLAFSGPSGVRTDPTVFTPEDYIPLFKKWGVSGVVRFNKKAYEARRFQDAGINHYDLYFIDGGIPTDAILRRFLEICDTEACLAVHCKAGLGRTGTCIACYMMRQYRFTASEIIGWLRLCRPGSVIGPQQHFLKEIEPRLWKQGPKTANSSPTSNKVADLTTSMHSMQLHTPPQPRKLPARTVASASMYPSSSSSFSSSSSSASSSSAASGSGTARPFMHVSESADQFYAPASSSSSYSSNGGSAAYSARGAMGSGGMGSSSSSAYGSGAGPVAGFGSPGYSTLHGRAPAAADNGRWRNSGLRTNDELSRSLPIAGGSPDAPQVSIPKSHFGRPNAHVLGQPPSSASGAGLSSASLYRNYTNPPSSSSSSPYYPGSPSRR